MIAPEAVVTFDRLSGFTIVESLGDVGGEAIVPRNLLRATFRSIGAFVGLTPAEFLPEGERARRESLAALTECAERLGANGIVRLRFDARERGDGATIVRAFGIAVVLDPVPEGGIS